MSDPIIIGKISQLQLEERRWGQYARLFTDWGGGWTGHYARIKTSASLQEIVGNSDSRYVAIVDNGSGIIVPYPMEVIERQLRLGQDCAHAKIGKGVAL